MISPQQASQLVHACATILGLELLQEIPEKTLIITGMRKTNDVAQGHSFIVKAFKPFGKIEEAAIAPNNRGFGKFYSAGWEQPYWFVPLFNSTIYLPFWNTGFVRFAKPESVKRALRKYREFEIEIQDVSISIKTVKSERPR